MLAADFASSGVVISVENDLSREGNRESADDPEYLLCRWFSMSPGLYASSSSSSDGTPNNGCWCSSSLASDRAESREIALGDLTIESINQNWMMFMMIGKMPMVLIKHD